MTGTERRAAFLALLTAAHSSPRLSPEEALEAGWFVFQDDDVLAVISAQPAADDFALASICVELERELADREWAAAERVLGSIEDDRLTLPSNQSERDELARSFVVLGWHRPAPVPTTEAGCK